MKIVSGIIKQPVKCVIYGPEGIGKSTFASQFPKPLFIDVEKGSGNINVDRTAHPESWFALNGMIDELIRDQFGYKTLVIDSIDWAEDLASQHVCAKNNKSGIEDFGYGKGYVFLAEEIGAFLNKLSTLQERGMNIVLTAHAKISKFEQPDEAGAYDRWELKLEKKVAPIVKEWASLVLFANYKTIVVTVDEKKKAMGGSRVMYSTHHSCWDAKNRHGFPDEMPFEFKQIEHILTDTPPVEQPKTETPVNTDGGKPGPELERLRKEHREQAGIYHQEHAAFRENINNEKQNKEEPKREPLKTDELAFNAQLYQLMEQHNVMEQEIQAAVASRGYYPIDTPIHVYDEGFVKGVLVAAWDKVFAMIQQNRKGVTA